MNWILSSPVPKIISVKLHHILFKFVLVVMMCRLLYYRMYHQHDSM